MSDEPPKEGLKSNATPMLPPLVEKRSSGQQTPATLAFDLCGSSPHRKSLDSSEVNSPMAHQETDVPNSIYTTPRVDHDKPEPNVVRVPVSAVRDSATTSEAPAVGGTGVQCDNGVQSKVSTKLNSSKKLSAPRSKLHRAAATGDTESFNNSTATQDSGVVAWKKLTRRARARNEDIEKYIISNYDEDRKKRPLPIVRQTIEKKQFATASQATRDIVKMCRRHLFDPGSFRLCVGEGADVMHKSPHLDRPLLHHLIVEGQVDCLAALLKTPYPIDFTVKDDINECNPFHLVCQITDRKAAMQALKLMVDRVMSRPPEDIVDWSQLNSRGRDFISWAAVFQDLKSVWDIIKDVPFFGKRPIPITTRPTQSNWDRLGKDQENFVLLHGTEKDHLTHTDVPLPDHRPLTLEDIKKYVEKGGNIMYQPPDMERPLLHQLILDGRADCVEACMQTKHKVDFTIVDSLNRTPLHCACLVDDPDKAAAIVQSIVKRLEGKREGDVVDWMGQGDGGRDFLSCANEAILLAKLFPIVKNSSCFPAFSKPYRLDPPLNRYDWVQLGEDMKYFDLVDGLLDDTLALSYMCKKSQPNRDAVKCFVAEAADLAFEGPHMDRPILHHFIRQGLVDCVEECMQSPVRINFKMQDRNKYTPGHTIFRCPTVEQGEKILRMVIERIETHPLDRVDWRIKDKLDHDFFAWAIKCKKTAPVYRLVKYHPYFRKVRYKMRRDEPQDLGQEPELDPPVPPEEEEEEEEEEKKPEEVTQK